MAENEKVEIEVTATNDNEQIEEVKEEVKDEIQTVTDIVEDVKDEVKEDIEDVKKKENENEKKISELSLNQLETKNLKEILDAQMRNIEILKMNFNEVAEETKETNQEMRLSMELIQDQVLSLSETTEKLMEITAALTVAVEILNPIEE